MAFQDFADTQYIKTVDTGEEVRIGYFNVQESILLKYIRLTVYINGAKPTTEKLKIELHLDSNYSSLYATSDWTELASIADDMTTNYWIGWVRVDFNREPINSNITYYPKIIFDNYTRNYVTEYYIGVAVDFPFPIYDNEEDYFYRHPIQTQFLDINNE